MTDLVELVVARLKAVDRVLDLGAGAGHQAITFRDAGMKVTAVDIQLPKSLPEDINWVEAKGEEYLESLADTVKFEAIFMRNILQFFDREWTEKQLPTLLATHLSPVGPTVINTFYKDPNPPFDHPFRSLYTVQELERLFAGWTIELAEQFEKDGLDLSGHPRHFFITQLVASRPNR